MPLLVLVLSVWPRGPALAQSAIYDPYGSQYNQSAQSADSGQSNLSGGQSNQTYGGYGGQRGQQYGSANGYGANGGSLAPGLPSSAYNPAVIQSPIWPGAQEVPTSQVVSPTTTGASPPPLYARPGATPGQFELFTRPPPLPGEFETYVAKQLGRPLARYGSALVLNGGTGFAVPATATVPPDYRLNPGDELVIGITGSVEANLRVVIDSEGRIFLPKIGAINLAGVRYGDLVLALSRRVNEQFKQARVSVVVSHLHGLNIYVTGFAVSPGAYTVSSLSTLVDAVLAAGGPSAAGSFRSIQLRRNGQLITDFDLYDLLLNGDKSHDAILQNQDVINIAPVGPETAVSGSVNAQGIYEAKPGETLADIVRFAGGLNALADDHRLIVVRLGDLDLAGSQQLSFAQARTFPAERGDILRILSLADVARPLERQAVLATIEGEIDHPGRYYLAPGSTLADLLGRAGGLTPGAFVFGTNFARENIQRQQKESFDKAINDLELSVAVAPLSALNVGGQTAAAAPARQQATLEILQRLRERRPDGRLVLAVTYGAPVLPTGLTLEDNDKIYIPPVPTTVGVFGAVFQPASFLFAPARRLGDYLKLAGGTQRYADRGQIFVVRANGAVLSSQQIRGLAGQPALPGDVIFVPVKTSPGTWERLKEIAAVVYQFSIGVATLAILAGR